MKYIKQNLGEPYFKELLWSKPETKALAGKLLVVGGNAHSIASPSEAYSYCNNAGAGEVKVAMPDNTKKLFGGHVPPGIEFAPGTPSGSFSKNGKPTLQAYINWADAILLAGDFSRSSETGILLEELIVESDKNFVITRDAIDYFVKTPDLLLNKPNITLVLSYAQLQGYLSNTKYAKALTFSLPPNILLDRLAEISSIFSANIIVAKYSNIYVLAGGQLSVTNVKSDNSSWRLSNASKAAVWLMQNPNKPFEALSTAVALPQ